MSVSGQYLNLLTLEYSSQKALERINQMVAIQRLGLDRDLKLGDCY